jgi:hypothetical protein
VEEDVLEIVVFGSGLTGFLIVSPQMMNQSNSIFSIYYSESLCENDVVIGALAISKIVLD